MIFKDYFTLSRHNESAGFPLLPLLIALKDYFPCCAKTLKRFLLFNDEIINYIEKNIINGPQKSGQNHAHRNNNNAVFYGLPPAWPANLMQFFFGIFYIINEGIC